MSFLEKELEKNMLTPKLQEFVELEIDNESKQNHMNIIAEFYLEILYEFFTINTGSADHYDRSTNSKLSHANCVEAMHHGLKHA